MVANKIYLYLWIWYWVMKLGSLICTFIYRSLITVFAPVSLVSQILYFCLNFKDLSFNVLSILLSVIPITVLVNVSTLLNKHVFLSTTAKKNKQIHFSWLKFNNSNDYSKLFYSQSVRIKCLYFIMVLGHLKLWFNIEDMWNFR